SLGRQDPFIQNFQPGANPNDHANATEPHSTQSASASGSSTSPSQLNTAPELIQENNGSQLVNNLHGNGASIIPVLTEAVVVTTNSQTSSIPPVFVTFSEPSNTATSPSITATSTTVNWVSVSGGNWGVGPNWDINAAPTAPDTVEINLPVTVTINQSEAVTSLVIGENALLNIISGGSLLVSGGITNA